jgi:broad specificity phosphatase PhoE
MIPQKHFYMIRHGETEANKNRVMAGSLDSPLTHLGRQQADQARVIVEQLSVKPKRIIHSHLSRARDTAMIINMNLGLPIMEDPDFAEIHVGELEGRTWDECHHYLGHGGRDWIDAPGGETFKGFMNRIMRAKQKVLEAQSHGPVLIVSHGGVFRAVWKLYGVNMEGVRNCHLHEFEPEPDLTPLPWRVHAYDYENEIIKSEAKYHD